MNNKMEKAIISNCEKSSSILTCDANSTDSVKSINNGIVLRDFIRMDQYSEAISMEMADLMTCNAERVRDESKILDKFTHIVQIFDPVLKVFPFGSTEYGFNGSHSNYNILIDTRESSKPPELLLRSFEKYIQTSIIRHEFDFITKKDANRVRKEQLKMIHKWSRIECCLIFDNKIDVVDLANLINDFITLMPICRDIIAYIRAWQNVISQSALENGYLSFQFNTYITSILVIFFLQMNYNMPTAADAAILVANTKDSTEISREDQTEFNEMVLGFFQFYGNHYEINKHLISVRIGRWQRIGQQHHFTLEQKCSFLPNCAARPFSSPATILNWPTNGTMKRTREDQSETSTNLSKKLKLKNGANIKEPASLKITDLIFDCMLKIFERLNFVDLLNYADSNTQLRKQAQEVYKQKYGSKTVEIRNVRPRPDRRVVKIKDYAIVVKDLKSVLQTVRCFGQDIEEIDFNCKNVDAKNAEKVERHWTSRALFEGIDKSLIGVCNLHLIDCHLMGDISLNELFPNISDLWLESSSFQNAQIIETCLPHLNNLKINHVNNMSVKEVLRLNPQLESLEFTSNYDTELIRYVSKNLPKLERLDLDNFPEEFNNQDIEVIHLNNLECFWSSNVKTVKFLPFSFDELHLFYIGNLNLNKNTIHSIAKISNLKSLSLPDWSDEGKYIEKLLKSDNILSNVTKIDLESDQQLSTKCILDFHNECKSIKEAVFPAKGETANEIKSKLNRKWLIELGTNIVTITLRE